MHFSISGNSFMMQAQCVIGTLEHCPTYVDRSEWWMSIVMSGRTIKVLNFWCFQQLRLISAVPLCSGPVERNWVVPQRTSHFPKTPGPVAKEEGKKFLMDTTGKFVEEFVLVECDIKKVWREQHEQKQQQQRYPNQTFSTPSTCTSFSAIPQTQRGNKKYMAYTGRLCPKRAPLSGLRYTKG